MEEKTIVFDEQRSLERLRHFLPSQSALKDFVHHNTLHAFQHEEFHEALYKASKIFGYATYLTIDEFRTHHATGKIREHALDKVIYHYCKDREIEEISITGLCADYKEKMLHGSYEQDLTARIGNLRSYWKTEFSINMDKMVHPVLFRLLSAFLDQGISIWPMPFTGRSFLEALRSLERNNLVSLFKTERARRLLMDEQVSIHELLDIVVGQEEYFEQYLFDQHFAHPGWSGFVSVVEQQPGTLLSNRKISLRDLIVFELLLEIDALDDKFDGHWAPLSRRVHDPVPGIFDPIPEDELKTVLRLWQEAMEWSYFDDVLLGIKSAEHVDRKDERSFQGLFCIDDREYSFRRHIENVDRKCETFGTPGFFGVEFYFQPENGKFFTKACPAPLEPKYLIKEVGRRVTHKKDHHFTKPTHSLFWGWLISNTLGFWSALKLFFHIFKPTVSPATAVSFRHMDKHARLVIDHTGDHLDDIQVGFTVEEMVQRVGNTLKSIGLTSNFAPLVYIVGHGGSSVNNTYYAGYDCGACCGRPGAVNARVYSYMANKPEVRLLLEEKGLYIPPSTVFVGAMHDTTRDEIEFYDEENLTPELAKQHAANKLVFEKALSQNARERSFLFDTVNSGLSLKRLHKEMKKRSVSLFEPRPEWNHSQNALCIIGRKSLYENLYLGKRPFINSYDYRQDPEGINLQTILSAAVPVCGGINLEYYFSRVDNQKLGAGTKLPHNVVGLFGVTNGIDDDLRPGLPSQMIEIHDPIRILFVIEHHPEVVQAILRSNPAINEWVENSWILCAIKDPETGKIYRFVNGNLEVYEVGESNLKMFHNEDELTKMYDGAIPVLINQ